MTVTNNLNEVKESNKYMEVKKIKDNIYTVVKIHRSLPVTLEYNHGILQ